jgi:hypothetical protein
LTAAPTGAKTEGQQRGHRLNHEAVPDRADLHVAESNESTAMHQHSLIMHQHSLMKPMDTIAK